MPYSPHFSHSLAMVPSSYELLERLVHLHRSWPCRRPWRSPRRSSRWTAAQASRTCRAWQPSGSRRWTGRRPRRPPHAGLQLHEGVVVVADGLGLARRRRCRPDPLLVALEHVKGGGVDLGHNVLAGQVLQRVDSRVLLHDNDLLVVHVGLRRTRSRPHGPPW